LLYMSFCHIFSPAKDTAYQARTASP